MRALVVYGLSKQWSVYEGSSWSMVCQSSGVYMRALVVYGLSKQWSVYEGSS